MKKYFFIFLIPIISINYSYGADIIPLTQAINLAKDSCMGISAELNQMKTMAGINTAVTGVGTVTAGGALATGITKSQKDKEIRSYEESIKILNSIPNTNNELTTINIESEEEFKEQIYNYIAQEVQNKTINDIKTSMLQEIEKEKNKLEEQSKKLGNIRTGLMAGDTATSIAGAVIAGKNQVKGDLKNQIDECLNAIKALDTAKQQARIDGSANQDNLTKAETIVRECSEWEFIEIDKINNRASGAMISSIVGAGTGLAGTITSASANSKKIRKDDTDAGQKKEANLNTAANVLAGAATGASLVSTVFNATQISILNKAFDTAQRCEEALQQ